MCRVGRILSIKLDKTNYPGKNLLMQDDEQIEEILRQVAAGGLSPEEAAARLAEIRRGGAVAVAESPVARVRVTGLMHPTRVVGDPEVRDAVVTGPHQAGREGDALVIRGMPLSDASGWFSFHWPERPPFGAHEMPLRPIVVRMNPNLPLEVEMAAGLLTVQGILAPIRADIQAGSAKLTGVTQPLDLKVTWGTVSVEGVLATGTSRIRCDAGTVKVVLKPGSSVRVEARSTLGKITLPGDDPGLSAGWTMGGDVRHVTVGEGSGQLQLEATTGAVWVELG